MELNIKDLEFKNQQLNIVIGEKASQIQNYLYGVQQQCIEKDEIVQENERLDDIIADLQARNNDLSEMLGQSLYHQAESYKSKGLQTLTQSDNKPTEPQGQRRYFSAEQTMYDGESFQQYQKRQPYEPNIKLSG